MNNFNKFNTNSSELQSLEDLGLDNEEIDSILYQSSVDLNQKELKVDWRSFEDHIVFGSAYWAVNFSVARIYDEENGYPWNGSLLEKNEWRLSNTAFENWWFDNEYPHQFGFAEISSGSFIEFTDYEKSINAGSGSLTVEFIVRPLENKSFNPIFSNYTGSIGVYAAISSSTTGKSLVFARHSSSFESVSTSYDSYISSSHRVSLVYDAADLVARIYIDGQLKSSSSFSVGEFTLFNNLWQIGKLSSGSVDYFFSGAIDDFRVYQSARPSKVIARNYAKQVNANYTASMKIYYKFNEVNELSDDSIIVDYSGISNHGVINGNVSKVSGSLGSWFSTIGDPILNQSNIRVSASVNNWLVSGSVYDNQNQSYIFNLVPSFLIDEEENIDMQLFLLLVARHYDRLRLYSKHLGYMLYSNESESNVAPDDFLNLLAANYGIDIGGVYEGSDPVEYFFGENIFTSSFSEPLQKIRNQIRRNLVNNLMYVIKTKSTRQSINAALKTLALPEDVLSVNEYSILAQGIGTTYSPKVVERRVLNFSSSTVVSIHSASLSSGPNTWQLSFALNSASVALTSSMMSMYSGSSKVLELRAERENQSSSLGRIVFDYVGAESASVSSSLLKIYDGLFTTLIAYKDEDSSPNPEYGFFAGRLLGSDFEFLFSSSKGSRVNSIDHFAQNFTGTLGTSGSSFFSGKMSNFQSWNALITSSALVKRRMRDFDSLSTEDFLNDGEKIKVLYKLNDFTASSTIQIHDYSGNNHSGSATGLISTTASVVFAGEYIDKLEPSYSYDISINNDKIEIFSGSTKVKPKQISKDIPFMSVELSPVIALNKEIVKWFGDLEKFDSLIGKPYDKYKYELSDLNEYIEKFFNKKLNTKVSFKSFINIIKWLDSNFVQILSQLIPLDLVSFISSFSIEPHILEYNKVEHAFPFGNKIGSGRMLETNITLISPLTAGAGFNVALVDPGRFGSPVSASGEILDSRFLFAESASSGLTYKDVSERKYLTEVYQNNSGSEFGVSSFGNGFYSKTIEDENYMKNTYGVLDNFDISKTPFFGGTGFEPGYLTSAYGAPSNGFFSQSASLNFVQDARWLYSQRIPISAGTEQKTSVVVKGVKYGGGAGQLPFLLNRTLKSPIFFDPDSQTALRNVGATTSDTRTLESRPIEMQEFLDPKDENSAKTMILWPYADSFNGARILAPRSDDFVYGVFAENERKAGNEVFHLGDGVDVTGYKYMSVDIYVDLNMYNVWRNRIEVLVKFAFSADGSEPSFETISSSSVEIVQTTNVDDIQVLKQSEIERQYKFSQFGDWSSGTFPTTYKWNISRNIPNSKIMKMYMEVILRSPETGGLAGLRPAGRFLAKGTFFKEERNE